MVMTHGEEMRNRMKAYGALRITANMFYPATNYDSYKIYIGGAQDTHSRL
jgi:hypothetical protein